MLTENLIPTLLSSRNNEEEIFAVCEKFKWKPDEVEHFLKENRLDKFFDRELLLWRMLHTFENLVLQYPTHTNGDLAEELTSVWNEKEQIKIAKANAKQFIDSVSLQLDSRKRAFLSLCDEDPQSCLIYLRKDCVPMVEWLIRFSLFVSERELNIIDIAKVVLGKHFPHVNSKNEMFNGFRQLGFTLNSDQRARIKFDYKRMRNYRRAFKLEDLPFAKGLAKLILEEIESEEGETFNHYRTALTAFLEGKRVPRVRKNAESVEKQESTSKPVLPEIPTTTPSLDQAAPEQVLPVSEELFAETEIGTNFSEAVPTLDSDSILTDVERLHTKVKQFVETASSNQLKVEALEKENQRLSRQLEEFDKNRKEVSYEKLIAFIKLIGGREGNFALHELYEESNINTGDQNSLQSQGRLLSLFSAVRLMGVEPYLNQYQLGEVVTVKKIKIGQLFTLKNMIQTAGDDVKVKVVGYGWTLDGKVLVQPIAEEVL